MCPAIILFISGIVNGNTPVSYWLENYFFTSVPSNNPRSVCSALSFLFLFVSKAASKVAESLKIIKKCLPLMYLIIDPFSS